MDRADREMSQAFIDRGYSEITVTRTRNVDVKVALHPSYGFSWLLILFARQVQIIQFFGRFLLTLPFQV
jgi:hypothetical protein